MCGCRSRYGCKASDIAERRGDDDGGARGGTVERWVGGRCTLRHLAAQGVTGVRNHDAAFRERVLGTPEARATVNGGRILVDGIGVGGWGDVV